MSDHDIEPTKLERLISEINRTGTSSYSGALKALVYSFTYCDLCKSCRY